MEINHNLLREKIAERGLTHCRLAELIGMHSVTVSNIVTKKTKPSHHAIINISEVLELEPYEFFEIFFPDYIHKFCLRFETFHS